MAVRSWAVILAGVVRASVSTVPSCRGLTVSRFIYTSSVHVPLRSVRWYARALRLATSYSPANWIESIVLFVMVLFFFINRSIDRYFLLISRQIFDIVTYYIRIC